MGTPRERRREVRCGNLSDGRAGGQEKPSARMVRVSAGSSLADGRLDHCPSAATPRVYRVEVAGTAPPDISPASHDWGSAYTILPPTQTPVTRSRSSSAGATVSGFASRKRVVRASSRGSEGALDRAPARKRLKQQGSSDTLPSSIRSDLPS